MSPPGSATVGRHTTVPLGQVCQEGVVVVGATRKDKSLGLLVPRMMLISATLFGFPTNSCFTSHRHGSVKRNKRRDRVAVRQEDTQHGGQQQLSGKERQRQLCGMERQQHDT